MPMIDIEVHGQQLFLAKHHCKPQCPIEKINLDDRIEIGSTSGPVSIELILVVRTNSMKMECNVNCEYRSKSNLIECT